MGRKTKYCLNFGKGKHLNNGKSPSSMHCSECYEEVKKKYESIEAHGGNVEGLRAARMLAGGSFGYERTKGDKERNLMAFFHYVMPEIPIETAQIMAKDIAYNGTTELEHFRKGYVKVKMY